MYKMVNVGCPQISWAITVPFEKKEWAANDSP